MFEGLMQPMHLLVIFVIAMLIFGPKKLADLGKGLGQGIREFKDAVKDGDHQSTSTPVVTEKEKEKTNIA
jgi:sec-independent protein translocase protein TatA